jgi:hypothetical protein
MPHEHRIRIVEFGHKLEDGDVKEYVKLYGCTDCDWTGEEKPETADVFIDHEKCGGTDNGCFGCKAQNLQFNSGDAHSGKSMTGKKWNKELQDYRDARKQGIQPAGTSAKQIQDAVRASDNLGSAYNAETMAPAKVFDKKTARALQTSGLEI